MSFKQLLYVWQDVSLWLQWSSRHIQTHFAGGILYKKCRRKAQVLLNVSCCIWRRDWEQVFEIQPRTNKVQSLASASLFMSGPSSSCVQTCLGVSEKQAEGKNELLYSTGNTVFLLALQFSLTNFLHLLNQSAVFYVCVCDSHFVFLLCLSSLLCRPLHEPLWHGNWKHHCSSLWCSTSFHSSCLQSQTSGPCIFSWH